MMPQEEHKQSLESSLGSTKNNLADTLSPQMGILYPASRHGPLTTDLSSKV
jgi:hypothetical protein